MSAWSCAHGVGRWMDDCGCHTGGEPGWNQALAGAAAGRVRPGARLAPSRCSSGAAPAVLRDPWAARDAYIECCSAPPRSSGSPAEHVVGDGVGEARAVVEALTLLESQRHALLMYTSCGWFFNDLAGIETVQIMRYAACCCDLLAELGERPPPVEAVLGHAGRGPQQRPRPRATAARCGSATSIPSRVDPGRVAAHLALTDLLAGDAGGRAASPASSSSASCTRPSTGAGWRCAPASVAITHRRTRRRTRWAYAAVHLGGLEVFGAVRPAAGGDRGAHDADDVGRPGGRHPPGRRVTGLLRMVVDRFGPREFGLESALPGVGEDLLRATSQALADRFVAAYDQLRSDHHDTLAALAVAGTPLTPELRGPIELALARRLEGALAAAVTSPTPAPTGRCGRWPGKPARRACASRRPGRPPRWTGRVHPGGRRSRAPPRARHRGRRRPASSPWPASWPSTSTSTPPRSASTRPSAPTAGRRSALLPLARRLGVSTRPSTCPGSGWTRPARGPPDGGGRRWCR